MTIENLHNGDSATRNLSGSRERKSGLSCAECRRSKLKCDRAFPCQSCIKRGCAAICPDGTLAATKGNKVLAAHAQKLQDQVKIMSARIKDLEQALSTSHSQIADTSPHPLLTASISTADSEGASGSDFDEGELHEAFEALGSLSIGVDGQAKFHGETAGSEYLQTLLPSEDVCSWEIDSLELGLPWDIVDLANAFPFGPRTSVQTIKADFLRFLPPYEEVIRLADQYYHFAAWMHDAVPRSELMSCIVEPIYRAFTLPTLDFIHPHRLSVLFAILAIGTLFDPSTSSATPCGIPSSAVRYHLLACATFSLEAFFKEATCPTVQALFTMIYYVYLSDRKAVERRWYLVGIAARVAQSIGLQRDSAGWKLPEDEIQRRRIMLWELYTWDVWGSLVYGRPPAMTLSTTNCKFPDDLDAMRKQNGETEHSWHAWKFRYSASCLSISVEHAFTDKVLSYPALLELDRKIRQFPIPAHLQSPTHGYGISTEGRQWSGNASKAMQQYCVICEKESTIMYLHRSYFAQAIRSNPLNPLASKFASSFLATYRSACLLIAGLKGLYDAHPTFTGRIWYFWSNVFSACIILGAIVVGSPGCSVASNVLQELDHACAFYETGSRMSGPNSATLVILTRLQQRARAAVKNFHDKQGPSSETADGGPDELEVLGGRTSVIATKSPSNSGSPSSAADLGYSAATEGSSSMASHPNPQPVFQADIGLGQIPIFSSLIPDQSNFVEPLDFMDFFPSCNTVNGHQFNLPVIPDLTYSSFYQPTDHDASMTNGHVGQLNGSSPFDTFQQSMTDYSAFGGGGYTQQMQSHTDTPADISDMRALNQEEIWRNFMEQLGVVHN